MSESITFTQDQYKEIWDMIFSQTGYPKNHPKHGTTPTDQPKEDALTAIDYFRAGYKYLRETCGIIMPAYDELAEYTVKNAFQKFITTTPIQPSTNTVDWEIKCIVVGNRNFWLQESGGYKNELNEKHKTLEEILKCEDVKILKVLRKSDNTLFYVGDRITYEGVNMWEGESSCKITKFSFHDGEIYINSHYISTKKTIKDWIKIQPSMGVGIEDETWLKGWIDHWRIRALEAEKKYTTLRNPAHWI